MGSFQVCVKHMPDQKCPPVGLEGFFFCGAGMESYVTHTVSMQNPQEGILTS